VTASTEKVHRPGLHPGGAHQLTEALADATGRSDEELRFALAAAVTVAVAEEAVIAGLRVLRWLSDLGVDVLARPGG